MRLTYLQLANKICLELGLQQQTAISNFVTSTQQDIIQKLASLNSRIINWIKFPERIRTATINIPADTVNNYDSVAWDYNGELTSSSINDKSCIIDATNREVYQYNDKFNEFYMGWASGTQYGLLNNTLLFAPYTVPRTLTVFYYTFNSAQDVNGNDIQSLTTDTDTTIIPAVSDFAEKILVNGVCYEIKKRTDNTRIQYWLDQFKSGQNELRNYAQGEDQSCQFIVGHEAESFVKPVLKGSWS